MMNSSTVACAFLVSLGAGCGDADPPCAPTLEIEQLSSSTPLAQGDAILIVHRAAEGVALEDERIQFRVETPCYCETFSRPASQHGDGGAGGSTPGEGDAGGSTLRKGCDAEIGFETKVTMPLPEGGDCRLTVTATVLNDTRTKELPGKEGACAKLTCDPAVTCVDTVAAATASASASD